MYGYGYRYNSGLVVGSGGGGAPFANTKSLLFDGSDDYLDVGVISEFQNATNFSISCWLKVPDFTLTNNYFFGTNAGGSYPVFASVTSSRRIYFQVKTGAYSSARIVAGQWHNVVCVFGDVTRTKIYIDGVLLASGGTLILSGPNTAGFFIGGVQSNRFNGNIDEVGIFSNSLTASEVTDIYNTGTPADLNLLATPPKHYYRNGDNDTYPTIADVGSSASNNGTMTNMTAGSIVSDVPL